MFVYNLKKHKIKKNILCFTTLFTIGSTSSQKVKFGVKGGLNIANQRFGGSSFTPSPSTIIGFSLGVLLEVKLYDTFALQPEILYSTQGSKFDFTLPVNGNTYNTQNQFNLSYVNVPIMLKYYAADEFCLEFGPQIGILTTSDLVTKVSGQSVTQNAKSVFNSTDFGLNLGLSYNLTESLFLQGRYNLGLSNIAKTESGDNSTIKNNVISFSLGYKFK